MVFLVSKKGASAPFATFTLDITRLSESHMACNKAVTVPLICLLTPFLPRLLCHSLTFNTSPLPHKSAYSCQCPHLSPRTTRLPPHKTRIPLTHSSSCKFPHLLPHTTRPPQHVRGFHTRQLSRECPHLSPHTIGQTLRKTQIPYTNHFSCKYPHLSPKTTKPLPHGPW